MRGYFCHLDVVWIWKAQQRTTTTKKAAKCIGSTTDFVRWQHSASCLCSWWLQPMLQSGREYRHPCNACLYVSFCCWCFTLQITPQMPRIEKAKRRIRSRVARSITTENTLQNSVKKGKIRKNICKETKIGPKTEPWGTPGQGQGQKMQIKRGDKNRQTPVKANTHEKKSVKTRSKVYPLLCVGLVRLA